MSEMSDFGNKNVRLFALFVPIYAYKSYCWVSPTYKLLSFHYLCYHLRMKKFDFENPKVRIKADVITLILLTLFAFCMVLYNVLLPNNTIINCDKNIDEYKVIYTNILGSTSIQKDIVFKISNIDEVVFLPRRGKYGNLPPNISVVTGNVLYHAIIHPSINEDDTKFLAKRISDYKNNTNHIFIFNRNEEINSKTRKGFILGILIYYLIGFIMIISDIYYYKKKFN